MSFHEEKKPVYTETYECDFCDKTFSRPDNVTRHIKAVHEGKKPFPCEVKSLTSEVTPSATQFFKRFYKISNNPGL